MVRFKLENIVKEFASERGEQTVHNFHRYLGLAINAVRELHMDMDGSPTWKLVPVDTNTQTISIPEGCMRVTKIGYLTGTNAVRPLILDNDMALNPEESEGISEGTDEMGKGYDVAAIQGVTYRPDLLNGVIKVASNIATSHVYLEYLQDREKINGKYMVFPYEIEAVKSFIRWANVRSIPSTPENKINRYERYWIRDRGLAEARSSSMTLEEMIQEFRSTHTGTIRM